MLAKGASALLLLLLSSSNAFTCAPLPRLARSSSTCIRSSSHLHRKPLMVAVEGREDGPAVPANGDAVEIFDAILENDVDSVSKYIAAGGDVNIRDSIGDSPLMLATENGLTDIIKLLVHEGGADINERAGAGMETPLILAAYYGYTSLCVFLLELCGADLEVRSGRGDTALNVASHWGNVDTVQYLLDRGADPNCVNHDGKRAGDDFQMVFVNTSDEEEIRGALEAARAAWPARKQP